MALPLPSIRGRGPRNAKVVIVTEYATADDIWLQAPLAGTVGDFFAKLLHEAGLTLAECYITSVHKTRPSGDSVSNLYSTTKSTAQKLNLTQVLFLPGLRQAFRRSSPLYTRKLPR